MNTRIHNSNSSAFSLVEAAIVLGVVGLIIGGIWVAASAVNEGMRLSKTTTGMLTMANRARTLFDAKNIPSGNVTLTHSSVIGMGIVPSDWVKNSTSITDPWGGIVYFAINGGTFQISLFNLPQSRCINLINKIANTAANTLYQGVDRPLASISNVSTGAGTSTFPISLSSSICQATNGEIAFLFRL